MILRKPYAFFIRMFKPIHLMLAFLIGYLIYMSTRIVNFLNEYTHSEVSVIGQEIRGRFSENTMYLIPIILMFFSLIIFTIMYKRKKQYTFYIINILAFLCVIVIYIYTFNFLGVLEKNIVSFKAIKLIHDLVIINIIVESISFIIFVVRGMGLNFKKFDFDSDIAKLEITDSDKEEFEFQLKVDLDENKRRRREKIRLLKYVYFENKFLINIVLGSLVMLTGVISFFALKSAYKVNNEGKLYSINGFSIGVDNTYIVTSDYRNNKVTDNYLIVVNSKINSKISGSVLYLNDFSLEIGDAIFSPTIKYTKNLIDLGKAYGEEQLDSKYNNYLFVFEIPKKYRKSKMIFNYKNRKDKLKIKLNPKNIKTGNLSVSKKINDKISFAETLGDIKFKISDFEIKNKFLVEYNYCPKQKDCILSREYLTPSIDENFDKGIIRFDVEYSNSTNLNVNSFYDFFEKFGSIYYKIGDKWYLQKGAFEQIKSKKKPNDKFIYVGVNSKILEASNIKLVFEIRGSKYEYSLR